MVRPIEGLMRKFIGSSILETKHNIVAFGETLDFTPIFQFIKVGVLIDEGNMSHFEFDPRLGGEYFSWTGMV